MHKLQEDRNTTAQYRDRSGNRIESIEELLRKTGFFGTPELEPEQEEEVLVG